jgi:hypothetical protein
VAPSDLVWDEAEAVRRQATEFCYQAGHAAPVQ